GSRQGRSHVRVAGGEVSSSGPNGDGSEQLGVRSALDRSAVGGEEVAFGGPGGHVQGGHESSSACPHTDRMDRNPRVAREIGGPPDRSRITGLVAVADEDQATARGAVRGEESEALTNRGTEGGARLGDDGRIEGVDVHLERGAVPGGRREGEATPRERDDTV